MTKCKLPLRILAVTNMLPMPDAPHVGRFVEQQIKALRRTGLEIDVLLVDRIKEGMRAYGRLPAMLRNAVDQFKPHLIHVMYGGVMVRIARSVIRDRPVIVTFHGSDLLGQPFERPLRRFFAAGGIWASKQAATQCDGIVVVAKHLIAKLPRNIPSSRIQVIPCGIDLDLFKPLDQALCREQLGWSRGVFHILFQATGDPVKRPELAVAAVERLREQGVKVELHYLRGVEYGQVPVWLNASDTLLITSHHEGSPTIVKEALACNLPIVSVPVGDIPGMIQGLDGCFLSDPEAEELAVRLQNVRMYPVRIAGRIRVHDISADHCARRLIQFYEEIVMSRKRREDESDQAPRSDSCFGQACS
jgi:teichuronic acid biosynthesis glycosyltransferase TuaC